MRLSPILLVLAATLALAPAARAQIYRVGETVRNFTLTDRATGQPVSLTDFAGKIVFLEWFAWWCPFCQAAAPQVRSGIVDYYASRGGNPAGLPVLHVSLNLQPGQEADAQRFINSYGLGQTLNDFNRAVANRFQIGGQPIFAIVNGVANSSSHRQWELLLTQLGYASTQAPIAAFRGAIDSVQAAQAVPPPVVVPPAIAVPPTIATAPRSAAAAVGEAVTFEALAAGTGPFTYRWTRNGTTISGASAASLTFASSSANAGTYVLGVTSPHGTVATAPAILGVATTAKVVGSGRELSPANIVHPNGNIFDQILLEGPAASFTADSTQITRLSFVDLQDDIVQVEFSGAGTVSVVLDAVTGPATPVNYTQPTVAYMKGHAGIVVTGANETSNLSIFSVGRGNAVNQALFRNEVTYDGVADIAFVAISSTDGKFGGLRAANASFFATRGLTGLYAPGVAFNGPIFIGDIAAADAAAPTIAIGSGADVRIAGGDLLQSNGRAVEVAGLVQLKFTAGSTSHNGALPARTNLARLEENGVDVTAQIVANPTL